LVAIVPAAISAGCAGGGGSSINVVDASVAATQAARTVEIDETFAGPGTSARLTARILYDFQHHVGEVLSLSGPSGPEQQSILEGSKVYLPIAAAEGGLLTPTKLPAGKKWVLVPGPSKSAEASPIADLADPTDESGGGMANLLSRLAPYVLSVDRQGTQLLDRVETTQYAVTLNNQAATSSLRSTMGPSGPLQLWVDSQGRIRQIRSTFAIKQVGTLILTLDYTNFGIPVHVTIPPSSEVETVQQLDQQEGLACSPGPSGSAVMQTCSSASTSGSAGDQPQPVPGSPSPNGSWPQGSTATAHSCAEAPGSDVIVWTVKPGHEPVARQIGVLNLQTCQFSPPTVLQTAPTGPGNCTLVAPVEANPGYNVNARPPPRPRGVVASVGEAC
jgi:hypothetical protein